jgi:glycyl-tRNA synthetase beta chain
MKATLLVELLTEELPPKSLRALSEAFCVGLRAELEKDGFLAAGAKARAFATPRRLAAQITAVLGRSPDVERELQGPPVKAATQAVEGFARKSGVAAGALERRQGPKGEVFVARVNVAGAALEVVLAGKVEQALKGLPAAKLMRWGAGEAQFVRPVHGLVMLHGERVVPGTVLGVSASSTTRGHRFLHSGGIALANAEEYEAKLRDGWVIADFAARRAEIERQLAAEAKRLGAALGAQDSDFAALLDEVAALVELPTVYAGEFARDFLDVPQECLILTMRQHQKYFPLFDASGKLLPKFLIVANMRPADPRHIVGGNQRVVRPRLEDARFFFNQDRKVRLEERVPQLARVVYHNKLGSQLERVERIQLLAGRIAREIGADAAAAERAAWLSKADLLSGMVGEFPELQGTMGRYYALNDAEPREVADAIEAHYRPRFAGDRLPQGGVACALALADKLETLNGMFSTGGAPTGDKDPFGLRRAALGVIRILTEARLSLALPAHAAPKSTHSFSSDCAASCASRATRPTRSRPWSASRPSAWTWCPRASMACAPFENFPRRRASRRPTSASATSCANRKRPMARSTRRCSRNPPSARCSTRCGAPSPRRARALRAATTRRRSARSPRCAARWTRSSTR